MKTSSLGSNFWCRWGWPWTPDPPFSPPTHQGQRPALPHLALTVLLNSLKVKRKREDLPTGHHSVDNRCVPLLAISQDLDGVSVFHAWSQARYNDASSFWSHFSGCFASLAWSHTQLDGGNQNKHERWMLPSLKRLQVHSHRESSFTYAHWALPRAGKEVGAHFGYSAINWRVSSFGTRAIYNRNVITAVWRGTFEYIPAVHREEIPWALPLKSSSHAVNFPVVTSHFDTGKWKIRSREVCSQLQKPR